MEIIRRNTDYALRALVYLAKMQGNPVFVRKVAEEVNVSEDFLRKIFQKLTDAGVVRSHRGPKGGFSIGKTVETITVLEVMETLQGSVAINKCFLGKDTCENFDSCELKDKLVGVQQGLLDFLSGVTIAQLLSAGAGDVADNPATTRKRG